MGFWVKNEWARSGPDFWLIWGNTTGRGWCDKFAHCFGHCIAVLAGYLLLQYNIWILMLGSNIWGIGYEAIWDKLICKSGASKFDLVANNIGMLFGVLIILVSQLVYRLQIPRPILLGIIGIGFVLTFGYKIWKLKRK